MVEILAYVGGSSRNPLFAAASQNPTAQKAAAGTLVSGPETNYGPAIVITYGNGASKIAPAGYTALGAGAGVLTAEQAYLRQNSDVTQSIDKGIFRTGLQHYLLFGGSEGRSYAGVSAQTLTADQLYLEENADVADAVRKGVYKTGLEHFLLSGAGEGRYYYGQSVRQLTPEELYLYENPEVKAAIAAGYFTSGFDHFQKMGKSEGRFYFGSVYGPPQAVYVPVIATSVTGSDIPANSGTPTTGTGGNPSTGTGGTTGPTPGTGGSPLPALTTDQKYLAGNSGAAQAVASGRYKSGLDYFLAEGYALGGDYGALRAVTVQGVTNYAERTYLTANKDVAAAVAEGQTASGEAHYFAYGVNEGFRSGYGALTSAAFKASTVEGTYLRGNRAAALAVANATYKNGYDYFLTIGLDQGQSLGRLSLATVGTIGGPERDYLTRNLDVAKAVAENAFANGFAHFATIGYSEANRGPYGSITAEALKSGTLEGDYLRSPKNTAAVAAILSGTAKSGLDYFLQTGVDRGQTYGTLRDSTVGSLAKAERQYLLAHQDVAARVATGELASGLDYFLRTGADLGHNFGVITAASVAGINSPERQYLLANKDIAAGIANGGAGSYPSGLAHYLVSGYADTRRGNYGALNSTTFNPSTSEGKYLRANQDVAAAVASGKNKSGIEAFFATGLAQGLSYGKLNAATVGAPGSAERQYLSRNHDVARAVADGAIANGLAHFLSIGYQEGRGDYGILTPQSVNPATLEGQYLRTYTDAAKAVLAGTAVSGLDYFLKTGTDLGHTYGLLRDSVVGRPDNPERQYLLAHQDVAARVARGEVGSGLQSFLSEGAELGFSYGLLTPAALGAQGSAERQYLSENLDIARAVALGNFKNGLEHYLSYGFADNRRTPYGALTPSILAPTSLQGKYLRANLDAARAVALGQSPTALNYFLSKGIDQGQSYGALSLATLGAAGEPERQYLSANPDVAQAVAEGTFASGLQHFVSTGYSETFRTGYGKLKGDLLAPTTVEGRYLRETPDALLAVARGHGASGLEYFLKTGASRGQTYGRLTAALIGPADGPETAYLLRNLDVAADVANPSGLYKSGLQHFLTVGYKEAGRGGYGSLNPAGLGSGGANDPEIAYLSANLDVAGAVAAGQFADGLSHFLTQGYRESWRAGYGKLTAAQVDPATLAGQYLRANGDAALAVARGEAASGFDYFLTAGADKGQSYGQLTRASFGDANDPERAYLRANRDVADAVAAGAFASGLQHFLTAGYKDGGRSFGALTAGHLDSKTLDGQYLLKTPAAARAVARGTAKDGLDYFLTTDIGAGGSYGLLTAATAGPVGSLERAYLSANRDVAAAVAQGQVSDGLTHFLTLGYGEGRSYGALNASTYNPATLEGDYLKRSLAAARAVAAGHYASPMAYFLARGVDQGETLGALVLARVGAVDSPERAYLQRNLDIARRVAAGEFTSGFDYHLKFGRSEPGRGSYGKLDLAAIDGSTPDGHYLLSHSDALFAVANGQAVNGIDYFLKAGVETGESYGLLTRASVGKIDDAERQYLLGNLDIAQRVASGEFASGLSYFLLYGHKEANRPGYGTLSGDNTSPIALEAAYVLSHPDAAAAIAARQYKTGLEYYLNLGVDKGQNYGKLLDRNVGRLDNPERQYLLAHQDVAIMIGAGQIGSGLEYFLTRSADSGETYGRISAASLGGATDPERLYFQQHLDVARNFARPEGLYTSGLHQFLMSGYADPRRAAGYGKLTPAVLQASSAELHYLRANLDAAAAVARGEVKTGLEYFLTVGMAKGQTYGKIGGGTKPLTDPEQAYLAANADVAAAVAAGKFGSGLQHYLAAGRKEAGRHYGALSAVALAGTPADNPELAYLSANLDVAAKVADGTLASGFEHFRDTGRLESFRTGYGKLTGSAYSADSVEGAYLRAHDSAAQSVARGVVGSGAAYFFKTGLAAGDAYGALTAARLSAAPVERDYLARNLDVAQAVASGGFASGLDHYLAAGRTEAWRGSYGALTAGVVNAETAQGAYLRSTPDAAQAVAEGRATTSLDYFLRIGVDKGQTYGGLTLEKLGPVGSAEREYLTRYQDVAAQVVAGSFASGLDHYLRSGYVDTRRAAGYGRLQAQGAGASFVFGSVDGKYLRANLDAAKAVAEGTAETGLGYFFSTGIQKGQSYGTLNNATVGKDGPELDYLKARSDVAQLVASGQAKSGLAYFLNTGADQGHSYGKIAAGQLGAKTTAERKYLTANLDVAAGVAKGTYGSGLAHYLAFGKAEGRVYSGAVPTGVTLDYGTAEGKYLATYADALAAVTQGKAKSGLEYFLSTGIDKGQAYGALTLATVGSATDLERQYLSRNLDVAGAVAAGTYGSGLAHYLDAGRTEAWRGGYGLLDPNKLDDSALGKVERAYLQANLDVARSIATGAFQGDGLQHYLTWGYKESNRGSYGALAQDEELRHEAAAEEAKYLIENIDVARAILDGSKNMTGLSHFLEFGHKENKHYGKFQSDKFIGSQVEVDFLRDNVVIARDVSLGKISDGLEGFVRNVMSSVRTTYGDFTASSPGDLLLASALPPGAVFDKDYFNKQVRFANEFNFDYTMSRLQRDIGYYTVNNDGVYAREILDHLLTDQNFSAEWSKATAANNGIEPVVMFGDTAHLRVSVLIGDQVIVRDEDLPHIANVTFDPTIVHVREDQTGSAAYQHVTFEVLNATRRKEFYELEMQVLSGMSSISAKDYSDMKEYIEYKNMVRIVEIMKDNPGLYGDIASSGYGYVYDQQKSAFRSFGDYLNMVDDAHRNNYINQYNEINSLRAKTPSTFSEWTSSERQNWFDGHIKDFDKMSYKEAMYNAEMIGGRNLSEQNKAALRKKGIYSWPHYGAWQGGSSSGNGKDPYDGGTGIGPVGPGGLAGHA